MVVVFHDLSIMLKNGSKSKQFPTTSNTNTPGKNGEREKKYFTALECIQNCSILSLSNKNSGKSNQV